MNTADAKVEAARREERTRRAAELARRRAVRTAAEHYGIATDLAARIYDVAEAEGIDPGIAFGLVFVESRFEPTAVGPAGALGLTQVMHATAQDQRPEVTRAELFEPEPNLRLGFRHLRWLLDRYDDDHRIALTAYNRGHGTVERAQAAGEEPYNGYARRVMENRLPVLEE